MQGEEREGDGTQEGGRRGDERLGRDAGGRVQRSSKKGGAVGRDY